MSKLIKNTSLYTLGNILPKVASFFLIPIYSRYLTPSDYGITSSMAVLTMILGILFTLGTERSLNRLYYDFDSAAYKRDFLGTISISIYVISFILVMVTFLLHSLVGKTFKSISFFPFYALAISTAFFNVLATVPTMYFRITEQVKKYIAISISRFIISTGLILLFVVILKQGAVGKLRSALIAALVFFPIFLTINIKVINFRFDFKILKNSLKFSLPMIPVMLSAWILNMSDRIFIERYFTLSDVGLYSMGYNIAGLTLLIVSSFYIAYNPYFFKITNTEDEYIAKNKLKKSNHFFLLGLIGICFIIAFFSKEVIYFLLDKRYHSAYKIVPIISLAYIVNQANGLVHLFIYQYKKTQVVMCIILFTAGLNIGLNFALIPVYGVYGAAFATLLSFLFQFIIGYNYSKKYYFIPFKWPVLLPLIVGGVILYMLFEFAINVSPLNSLLIKIAICMAIVSFCWFKYQSKIKVIFLKEIKNG